jgi:hypothetical protein
MFDPDVVDVVVDVIVYYLLLCSALGAQVDPCFLRPFHAVQRMLSRLHSDQCAW